MPALLARLQADPRPRLTWYGSGDRRVELTGRVLVTWVAKTAHLLAEEADVVPGSRVLVRLGPDWRAPVLWLATWYLGGEVIHEHQGSPPDVDVVGEGAEVAGTTAVVVVVPDSPLPGPVAGLPTGAVDFGAEVSGQPDTLPAPGPARRLGPPAATVHRVLTGPDVSADLVVATWAAGGSVVMHTGLPTDVLDRISAQENVSAG